MLTPTLRTGSELSQGEKADIIQRMFAVQNPGERDAMRKSLVTQYGISEGTINSLIAHETMRRKKNAEGAHIGFQEGEVELPPTHVEQEEKTPTQALQQTTQTRAYTITSLSGITEQMREDILEEFSDVIQDNVSNSRYDFYQDIEAISDYYNIDPSILEQFLRNSYKWIGAKLDELRNGRVLTEEEKLMIRLYVSEGIDEKDRKARRKEMAKTYNVSTYVIGAITAWKLNEDGGVVLKKDGLDIDPMVQTLGNRYRTPEIPENVKSNEDLGGQAREPLSELTPADQVAPSNTEQIQDHQIPETSDEAVGEGDFVFSEDDKLFVQELAKDFDLNNDEQRKSFLDDVFDLFPEATIDDVKRVILDFPDDITHANAKRSGEGMGALINYNNEIKNKWRQKLKEFIDENTDREKRATMNVLCLPGMECLEIPLYLELGFRPENIVGVEAGIVQGKKDPEVIARFEANAKRYGIQTRIGKLEKVLETEETVFDVVSLDFLGPMTDSICLLLNQLRVNVGGVILTNFLNKRESSIKYAIDEYSMLYDTDSGLASSSLDSPYIGLGLIPVNSPQRKSTTYDVKMKGGLGRIIASTVINVQDDQKLDFQKKHFPNLFDALAIKDIVDLGVRLKIVSPSSLGERYTSVQMRRIIMIATHIILMKFFQEHGISGKLLKEMNDYLLGAIKDLIVMSPGVLEHKVYNYKGKGNSTMISDFLRLGGNRLNEKSQFKKFTYFLVKIINLVIADLLSSVRGQPGKGLKIGVKRNGKKWAYPFQNGDKIYIESNENHIYEVDVSHIFVGYDHFTKYWSTISSNYSNEPEILK